VARPHALHLMGMNPAARHWHMSGVVESKLGSGLTGAAVAGVHAAASY
jgi:hypothetical protein